jgi:hypothetical protein
MGTNQYINAHPLRRIGPNKRLGPEILAIQHLFAMHYILMRLYNSGFDGAAMAMCVSIHSERYLNDATYSRNDDLLCVTIGVI